MAPHNRDKNNGGKIWVHNDDKFKSILQDSQVFSQESTDKSQNHNIYTSSNSIHNPKNDLIQKASEPYQGNKFPLNLKEMPELQWSQGKCGFLLEREHALIAETDWNVFFHELHDRRRQEILHRQWTKQVYDPLRWTLSGAIHNLPWLTVESRRHQIHKLYLEYVNTKGYAFLDTLNPKEYTEYCYPYGVPVKVTTKVGHDPLLHDQKQRYDEDHLILRCMTGHKYNDSDIEQIKQPSFPLVPLGRHGTDSKKWLQMPLCNIESTPRTASRRRIFPGRHNESVLGDLMGNLSIDMPCKYKYQKKRNFLHSNQMSEIIKTHKIVSSQNQLPQRPQTAPEMSYKLNLLFDEND